MRRQRGNLAASRAAFAGAHFSSQSTFANFPIRQAARGPRACRRRADKGPASFPGLITGGLIECRLRARSVFYPRARPSEDVRLSRPASSHIAPRRASRARLIHIHACGNGLLAARHYRSRAPARLPELVRATEPFSGSEREKKKRLSRVATAAVPYEPWIISNLGNFRDASCEEVLAFLSVGDIIIDF